MKVCRIALSLLLVMTLLLGGIYPVMILKIGQYFFNNKVNGSLVYRDGVTVGSALIAQSFTSDQYFWPRPSACGYALPSAASNLSMTSLKLNTSTRSASGSGLDPHISPEDALQQLPRISKCRQLSDGQIFELKSLISQFIETRDIGVFGAPRINVVVLNMALDAQFSTENERI
jgi:K+-transporting ATPase ATPase C chain